MKYPLEKQFKRPLQISLFLLTLAFVWATPTWAQRGNDCYPPKPTNSLVADQSGVLSSHQVQLLDEKLIRLNRETSNQIVIVIINELCEGDAAQTAYRIGENWAVGQDEFDNGIVILVKPTGGAGDRKAFIATGYGLEGAIPDATAKLIVDQEMIPAFRGENYFAGLDKAVDVLSELARGEYNHQQYAEKSQGPGWVAILPFLFFIGLWILMTFTRTRTYARTNDLGFWAALALMNSSSRSHGGSFGSFSSGSGGFGGGSGGFGGFGGGSFGGGGAGGSW